jgi:hypothetical protein
MTEAGKGEAMEVDIRKRYVRRGGRKRDDKNLNGNNGSLNKRKVCMYQKYISLGKDGTTRRKSIKNEMLSV